MDRISSLHHSPNVLKSNTVHKIPFLPIIDSNL